MRYVCGVCGYTYDEEKEGTPFAALPDDWQCPLCRAPKSAFKPEAAPESAPVFAPDTDGDLKPLTAGQLAALCTNLARACEKQYNAEEAGLFKELASYFTTAVPEVPDTGVAGLAESLAEDVSHYAGIRAVADEHHDRGAARALVWGEKVTRMLASLAERYQKEGEAMLRDTEVWLCKACGFVYIGDVPPERCPVCRVPADRFEKTEGRRA